MDEHMLGRPFQRLKKMKIVDLDAHALNPGDLSWEGVEALGELTVYARTAPEDIVARASGAAALLINKIQMTREVLEQLPHLIYIGELATGYNNIDLEAATELGITVTNIPAYSTPSVAQHVFALLLAVVNRVEHYAEETKSGQWGRSADFCYWDTPLLELSGKTLGIVGFGNIGQQVATIARAFGMHVCVVTSKPVGALPSHVQKMTFEGMLATCDVVSLHCPLTPNNHHLINNKALEHIRPGAILVNTARGPLVDEEAVAQALHDGCLGAYCADVLDDEPPANGSPLFAAPNAYITPHLAWATLNARQRLLDIAVQNLKAFMEGKPQNKVNR